MPDVGKGARTLTTRAGSVAPVKGVSLCTSLLVVGCVLSFVAPCTVLLQGGVVAVLVARLNGGQKVGKKTLLAVMFFLRK